FLESLQALADRAHQPVQGFLRVNPRSVTRDDVMLEVPADVQREIAGRVDDDVSLRLRILDLPGAGKLKPEAGYKVLESAGYTVTLSEPVKQEGDDALRIAGRVSRATVT